MKKTRLLLLLALLMTAATGAWAQDAKHLIKATYDKQTRLLEQPLPYATTVGALYEAVTGQSFSDLLSIMTEMPLTKISSNNTDVVSIGELNGASTPVTVKADGEATVSLSFSGYYQGIFVSVTPPLYVTLNDGTENPTTWTASTDGTNFGALPIGGLKGDGSETVTLKYNGRLKVKSVTATTDAVPAKEPATVTTAPTGAAIVGRLNTNSTALVSGGVADGGTLWYAVTTTNTKPTSTDGFSDAVPTAKDITASGTVYVWYYVKADDTHSDSEIAATAIEVPVADIVWDATNVWDLEVWGDYSPYTKEGVTLSGNSEDVQALYNDSGEPEMKGISFEMYGSGGFTFTAPAGKAFTKIEMTVNDSMGWDYANLGSVWAFKESTICTVTWKGTAAASTVGLLTDANVFSGTPVNRIAFYLSE